MDDVELIVPDDLEYPELGGIFPDFSQVQIQVHGPDVAENIIGDKTEQEILGTAEYIEPHIDDDIQEISDGYPEHIAEESETITEDFKENMLTEVENIQDTPILNYTDLQEDIEITESNNYLEEDLNDIERIPDKDISKYDAVIEEYPDYANVSIKEEIEPFMGTDYTDFDAGPIEEHNSDDLPPEDIYHCNNVIILGTKPCHSTSQGILRRLLNERDSLEENNEVKKENLNAVVLLEDWGVHLEKSHTFCKDCGILFGTPNELDAHKMTAHSFLVPVSKNVAVKSTTKPTFARRSTGAVFVKSNKNIARKSTGSKAMGSTFCNHCNQVFPDHSTLIKHLYELLPLKQFTCNICNAVYQTQEDLTDHNVVHIKPEKLRVKKEKTDKKGADFKKKPNGEVKKKDPIPQKVELEAIPKSILFQCPKCNAHFVTAIAGYLHYKYCDMSMSSTRRKPQMCDICNRRIHAKDLNMHKKQHKVCTNFRVFKINKNLSEKTLCKCPNCELHFSDFGMNMHLKHCGKIQSAHCQKCNLLVPKTRIHLHMKMHSLQNLKPKDFINIQYSIQQCAVKRKLEPPMTPTKKIKLDYPHKTNTNKNLQKVKIKKEPEMKMSKEKPIQKVKRGMLEKKGNKFRMYFCTNCNGCCYLNTHRVIHLNKQCISSKGEASVICPDCGLQFTRTTIWYHRSLHKKELTIHNVAFFDLHTLKRTVPSFPNYPKCPECKINFFELKVHAEHICGEDYETCNICGEKYHHSAYDAHIELHKVIESRQPTKMETKLIPELMKKYKSLNKMWNIAYCCKMCDILTDQYDKAVEHSQGHINHEPTMKNIKCYICNLKIDETCWSKHSELHSRMSINSKDFKILSYNPRKLLTEEWFELFDTLPKEQIGQVTEKSVYGYERRFKMKLLKEGRSEFTVYCCSDCKVGCRNNEIEKHINSTCRNSTNVCKICSIPFSDISTLRNHQILHMKGITKEEFRVVTFTKQKIINKAKEQTKNKAKEHTKNTANKQTTSKVKQQIKHLPKQKPRLLTKRNKNGHIKVSKLGSKSYKGVMIDSKGKYILYRCKGCKSCIHFQRNIHKHDCSTKCFAGKCQHCGELINKKNIMGHVKRHEERPDFNANNFTIKLFDPPNKASKTKKKTKAITSPSKEPKLNSPTKTKADTSNASSGVKAATVYKCDCGLHYTSLKNIEKHVQTCESENEISKEHCSKCGLLFPTNVLVSHLCKHHSKNSKFTVELYEKDSYGNVDSVESTSESPVPTKKTRFDCQVKLYKCSECNVYYVNQNTCYRHVYKNHQVLDQRQCIECKLCGLQFSLKTLSTHVSRHHRNELSLDNILVEEYCPVIGGPPKVDLYVAADKVQSFQVTSSIEGEC